ncbi:restriction endonuclease subunit S [uncultured Phascolarctobacterium sp.]|uniref:restriction endonuclease subunit S n=1 Tax=uncultured Phascolarctobacterium sp. TaxID=512296 RepID=UPI0025DCD80C|nr:restriction endonuclease subunit S [uncultured Phascolarctobacterium sp.]
MNTKRAPKVRFKGFTDAWELRKFESIAARASSISADPTLPRVEYEDIISGIGLLNKDVKLKGISKPGIVFNQGDILYGKLRPYLHNWFLPSFSGLAVGDFWVLQPKDADSSFLFRLIQGQQFDDVANQSIGTKMPRADWNLVSKTLFFVPTSIDEQALIGRYFRSIDNLITLHQRKLDKMKDLKKAFLNLIFSQKLRFYGFTDSWELRNLDDEVRFYNGLTYTPSDIVENDGTLVLRSSNVQNGEIVTDDNVYVRSEVVSSENVQVGDITVVVRNGSKALIGKHAKIRENMYSTVIGAFMTGIRSEHSSFINALLSTQSFDSEIKKNMGATINQITGGMFKRMKFFFPENAEQEIIGQCFDSIDNLITLRQNKIDSLKEVKKILLRNMLI